LLLGQIRILACNTTSFSLSLVALDLLLPGHKCDHTSRLPAADS
jgi:hypothetical protein